MARDGSGDYSRVVTPPTNGDVADADDFNSEINDIATALSDSINKAGTKAFAASQPMGGFKLTGLGAGTSNGDSVRYEQLTGLSATYQPLDALLTAIAALTTADDRMLDFTGTDTVAVVTYATVLSNIGALASSSYTAADVLSKLLTVDGAGSGLDADLLDGISSAAFNQPGVQHIPIMASAMTPRTTNGAAPNGPTQLGSGIMSYTLDFDQTTEEYAQFSIVMPKSWNEGSVQFIPYWTADSGSGDVRWIMRAAAISNDDVFNASFGGDNDSTDTLIATGDVHVGPQSGNVTFSAAAENDLVIFEVYRQAASGSDTLNADARLIGVKLVITTNAANDA